MDPNTNTPPSSPQGTPKPFVSGDISSPPAGQTFAPSQGVGPHMPASASSTDIASATAAANGALPLSPIKKRSKAKVIGLVVGIVVAVLGAGSAAAYFGYYVPNKPENVLGQALINTFSTTSVTLDGEVMVEDKSGKAAPGSTAFSGEFDESGAFKVSAEIDALTTRLTAEARSIDGKSYYLKVGGLAGLEALLGVEDPSATLSSLIKLVNDQWFEINESLISELSSSEVSSKVSDADRQKILDAYKANQFIVVSQKFPDQAIDGTNSYHYRLGIDKTKLKSFTRAIKDAKLESLKITDEMLLEITKGLDTDVVDGTTLDIWIAKDTKRIKQLLVASKYSSTESSDQTIAVRATMKEYNQAVKVEKPANAKSIMELIGPFMQGFTSGAEETDSLLQQVQGISL